MLPHVRVACFCGWQISTVCTLQVLAFYKGKSADVQSRAAAAVGQDGSADSGAQADEQSDALRDLAADITHLLCYISLNLAGEASLSGVPRASMLRDSSDCGPAVPVLC